MRLRDFLWHFRRGFFWLTTHDIHEICEGLRAPQHKAEFSIGVNQIGQLTKPSGMNVGHGHQLRRRVAERIGRDLKFISVQNVPQSLSLYHFHWHVVALKDVRQFADFYDVVCGIVLKPT
jgi:hypothetical protein